jgi:hypothetical protein
MCRPGKAPVDTRLAHLDAAAPLQSRFRSPSPVAWPNRTSFGCTQADLTASNALGASDAARWTTWLDRQFNLLDDDTACSNRVSGANFQSLNLTPNQLWTTFHSDTANYSHRMLPIAEVECATIIRQTCSKHQLFEVMVDFWHDHFSVFGWDYDGGPIFPAFDALFRDTASGNRVSGNLKSLLMAGLRVGVDDVHARPVFELRRRLRMKTTRANCASCTRSVRSTTPASSILIPTAASIRFRW